MTDARRRTVAALTVCLLLIAGLESDRALAQVRLATVAQLDPHPPVPLRERKIDLEFPGGTVEEYILSLREVTRSGATPEGLNVVIDDPRVASVVRMPPISLKRVQVDTAMELIKYVATRDDYLVEAKDLSSRGEPVYIVSSRALAAAKDRGKSALQMRIEVFSVRDLAGTEPGGSGDKPDRFKVETVLTALETALSMSQAGPPMSKEQMRYHPESGLLFLYGTEEQISVVRRTLDRMQGDSASAMGTTYFYRYADASPLGAQPGAPQPAGPAGTAYGGRRAPAEPQGQGNDTRRYEYFYRQLNPRDAEAQPRRALRTFPGNAEAEIRKLDETLAATQRELAALKEQLRQLTRPLESSRPERERPDDSTTGTDSPAARPR